MFDEKTLLARLQNGENVDDIAKELTAALNNANTTFQEEEKKKNEAARINENKVADLDLILGDLRTWFHTYYGKKFSADTIDDVFEELNPADLIKSIDSIIKFSFHIGNPVEKTIKSADDVLSSFLDRMGW